MRLSLPILALLLLATPLRADLQAGDGGQETVQKREADENETAKKTNDDEDVDPKAVAIRETAGTIGNGVGDVVGDEVDNTLPEIELVGKTIETKLPELAEPGSINRLEDFNRVNSDLDAPTPLPESPLPEVITPNFPPGFKEVAQAIGWIPKEDTKRVVTETERIIEEYPDEPASYWLGAWAQNRVGRREEALDILERGLEIAPEDKSLTNLQKLLTPKASEMAQKEVDRRREALMGRLQSGDAAADFGAGFAGRATAEQAPQMAGMVNPAMFSQTARQAPNPRALAGIQGGLSALKVGDAKAAVSHFTEAIRRDPQNPVPWRFRAMALHQAGANELAVKDANRAVSLDPKDHWAFLVRAKALTGLKQYETAKIDIQAALELDPKSADAYATRARLHHVQGEHAQELQDYRTAVNLDPAFADLFRGAMREAERLAGKSAPPKTPLSRNLLYPGAGLLGLGFFAAALLRRRGQTTITQGNAQGVGGFDIVRRIGRGGMGEVWEGLDRALERRVAIKKLVPEIASVPRERQRFLKEARTVAALKHPNIIEIHQVVETGDDLYLVFEFVDGVSLDSVLAEKGRLSPPETLEVLRQSALALDFAHGRGVIHQDLKPANIMVEGETVKVMDFGIARRVAETMGAVTRVEVVGTPSYMAPEQAFAQASPETDIFALGATLYEMLSGQRPFGGAAGDFSKLQKAFVPLSRTVPEIPEAVDAVIARALDPDPKLRFHSAGELFTELEAAVGARA